MADHTIYRICLLTAAVLFVLIDLGRSAIRKKKNITHCNFYKKEILKPADVRSFNNEDSLIEQ